ncbi:MAG TPA: formate dehydrogenase accessory protein FdhE [Candidatus Acidoferrales bacterium]|nr:formate dehydrogenase accessory protein FdhE [Candidatus Acidoferrales bacterium]
MTGSKWDQRIRRARELAIAHPFAAEALVFYERLAGFQKALYSRFGAACGDELQRRPPGSLRRELDLFVLLPQFRDFLAWVETMAPPPIAHSAGNLESQGAERWQELLLRYWNAAAPLPDGDADALLAWMYLQPYAESLADHTEPIAAAGAPARCPLCSGEPQVGVLRPEGDGAKRSLVCSLCATEWAYRRLVCPSCGEEDVGKLALYVADQFRHIRVEACDSCRRYIKTVDLTKNGRAVPVVDELAAIPLNLWARENGYTKLRANWLGI